LAGKCNFLERRLHHPAQPPNSAPLAVTPAIKSAASPIIGTNAPAQCAVLQCFSIHAAWEANMPLGKLLSFAKIRSAFEVNDMGDI
jgi:hypothetical protein